MDHQPLFERACAHASRFRDGLGELPAWPDAHCAGFAGVIPEVGEDPIAVIDALAAAAEPGLSVSAGPRFFGWVIGASEPVGVAADMMTSAWGQNAGNHACSPAAAEAERVAGGWLVDLLRLPAGSSVGFVTGATMANFVALAAARGAVLAKAGWDVEADGLFGAPKVRVMLGADAHATVLSALRYLGFGSKPCRIATDDQGRMDPAALEAALAEDRGPVIVIAQAGQINTGAFDPFTEIVVLAKATGAWVHVDGAFGLWARAVPALRHLTEGIEGADSWVTDGHKWLQVPYDCGFAIVRDRTIHQRAMTQWSSYLPTIGEGDRVPSAFVPELSRRARGVPVYALLKTLGRQGVAEMVEHHCALARQFAELLSREPGVRVLNTVSLNQVIVSFGDGDAASRRAATEAVIARIQKGGICFAAGAQWRGDWVMRLSVASGATTARDIEISAAAIVAAWRVERLTQRGAAQPDAA